MRKSGILLLLLSIVLASSAFAAEHRHDVRSHARPTDEGTAQEPPYTLKEVMQDLALNLARIEYGIMTNNRLMVKAGAEAIAHHPNPKGGIEPYIKKNRSAIEKAVPAMDAQVHNTAVEMAMAADALPMLKLQEKADKIAGGCVGCHNAFRD